MNVSVGVRLGILAGVAVIGVAVVAGVAQSASAAQGREAGAMNKVSNGMSKQWNADMLHDGIRADAMSALYASSDEQRTQFEVDAVKEHAAEMLGHITEAQSNAPADLQPLFDRTRPKVEAYGKAAVRLVDLAGRDKAAAEAELPVFLELFGTLETEMGEIDDAMLAAVAQHETSSLASARTAKIQIWSTTSIVLLLLGGIGWWVLNSIRRPLLQMVDALHNVAQRDLTVRVDLGQRDEFGVMGRALNEALTQIGETIRSAGDASAALAGASLNLSSVSNQLGQAAQDTAGQAGVVSTSAMDVSNSVEAMSAATEQMGASIREIASQTATAAEVAQEAARSAETTSDYVTRLNEASVEIGEIVQAITSIAEQTNLLALNATIEAARAGDAGKGFAVVATEVKELAQETSRATDDISSKIESIQGLTGQATQAIEEITSVIMRINENQTMVAAAVEEQSATTAEISRSVGEIAGGAVQIAGNVSSIAGSTDATSQGAGVIQHSANELNVMAQQVTELIGRFRF